MKLFFSVSILFLFSFSLKAANIDLFVIAGQSNAQGFKSYATSYPTDQNNLDNQIKLCWKNYWNQSPTPTSSNGWINMQSQPGGNNNNLIFGPEVTFSRKLKQNGYNPYIFKCAIPSSSLADHWKGPTGGGIYDQLIADLNESIILLSPTNTVTIRGFVWIQGENDALNATSATAYQANLTTIINHFRNTYGSNIPVLLGVNEQFPATSISQVIGAQMNIANTMPNVLFTSMYGLGRADQDIAHLSPQGTIDQGNRLYSYFKSLLDNKWENKWSNNGSGNLSGWNSFTPQDRFAVGDFDGNGSQELLGIQTLANNADAWSTQLYFQNNTWNWGWSNYGNGWMGSWKTRAADKFYVGNFDGLVGDELLCTQGDGNYMTLLKLQSGNWTTLWSNWGTGNVDFIPFKGNLLIGDFDGNGKAEALGVNGNTITVFNYINNNFVAGFTTSSTSHVVYPYRTNLKAGDFNGDGKTDLIGFTGYYASVFYYNTNVTGSWQSGESTNGVLFAFGTWYLPASSTDNFLIGNIDADAKEEIFCIQGASNGAWATTVSTNTSGGFSAGWSNNGSPAYIDDWSVSDIGGDNTKYFLVKANAALPKYLLAMRRYDGRYLVNMYKGNSAVNYALPATDKQELIADNKVTVYPNPAADQFKISYSLSEEGGVVKLEIYNTVGQLVKSTTVNGAQGLNENTIDVSDVAKGMYLMRIEKEGAFFTEKISIQQ